MNKKAKDHSKKSNRRSAIVLGGSIAGMWTARVLADHFDDVIVVERDELPETAEIRPGVPQGRQYHIMLRRGLQIMDQLFPGLDRELIAAGANRFDQLEDVKTKLRGQWLSQYRSGEMLLSASRALLETTMRKRLQQNPRVQFMDGAETIALLPGEAGQGVAGVEVRWRHGPQRGRKATLEGDFVVDATGRNSRAPKWLAQLGYAQPKETVINSFLGYVSRRYRRPQQTMGDWQMLYILPNAPDEPRAGLIFPEEGDTWVVMMAGINKDYPPTDEEGFMAYARSIDPLFYAAVESAEPLSPPYGYRRTENRWRHYEALSPWPERFVIVGDAFAAFNPVYGQGMTMSAMTAVALDKELQKAGDNLQGLAQKFQKTVARVTRPVWLLTTGADLAWPGTEGGSEPGLMDRFTYWYTDRVMDAIPHDNTVRRAFLDVNHLMRPATALMSPQILWRVLRHMLRREKPRTPAAIEQDLHAVA